MCGRRYTRRSLCGPTLLFLRRVRRINRKDAGTHGMFMRCFVESQLPQSATLCRHLLTEGAIARHD